MEEGTDLSRPQAALAAHDSPLPSGSGSPRHSAEPASTSLPPPTIEGGDELHHAPRHHREHRRSYDGRRRRLRETITYQVTISPSSAVAFEGADAPWLTGISKDDTLSCLAVLLTFWFFASMTLILGFYGSVNIVLGPNSSRLLCANSYFVQDIKLQLETNRSGSLLYGFSSRPPLGIRSMWTESHNVSVPSNFHKAWVYYLNEGSQVEVSYHVKSPGSSSLVLVIAQGEADFDRWMEDPLFFTTTLSWNLINGTGFVQQKILKSAEYYVAVGNLNSLPTEVEVKIAMNALLYNTTRAYYNCSLHQDSCVMKLSFFRENAAILSTSGPEQGQDEDSNVWYVKMSYGPRWIMYFVGSGFMSIIILLVVKIISCFYASSEDTNNSQPADEARERAPLLSNKDDDNSSLGSSYDSVSNAEGDVEEHLEAATKEPGAVSGSEVCESQHLCAICCNAPKDCFFLPCGHCATCFTCGTRVTEDSGTCPICRRRMKKVKKIFTV